MNKARLLLLWAVLTTPLPTTSRAGDRGAAAAELAPQSLGTLVEYIAIDAPAATKLLRGLGSEYDDAGMRQQLGAEIDAGAAELLESAYLQSLLGKRAKVEAVHELIHEAEAEPDPASPPPGFTPLPAGPMRHWFDFLLLDDDWLRNPTCFRIRPIGQSLELEIQTRAGPAVLYLSTERTTLDGEFVYGQAPWIMARPKFHTWKTCSPVRPRFGKPKLVSAHPEKCGPLARTVFVFATVHPVRQIASLRETDGADPQVGVTLFLQLVETDAPLAGKILEGASGGGENEPDALREAVEDALERGAAKTVSSTLMRTKVGQRAKSQPIEEYIYPTAFNPGKFARVGKRWKMLPPTPRCFELRPLGTTLEADVGAISEDGESIVVNLDLDVVQLDREISFKGAHPGAKQPIFNSLRVNSEFVLNRGEDQVIAMVTPRKSPTAEPESKHRILFLLHAEVE